jgi:tetratricopeptide (TPR) repeat protein
MTKKSQKNEPEEESSSVDFLRSVWWKVYWLVPPLLAFMASVNSLRNGFVHDDGKQVLGNAMIKSLGNLTAAFTTSVWSFAGQSVEFAWDTYYRPLFSALFTINYAFFETRAWGWHLSNVLIHAAVSLLVFVVVRELTGRRGVSLIAACLFAVHPVHAESVAWISGVTDPLMSLFLLPCFYFYLRYRRQKKIAWMAASSFFFLFALLSKETAGAFPLIVFYCELALFNRDLGIKKRLISAGALMLLFALPLVVYLAMRGAVLSGLVLGALEPQLPVADCIRTVPLALVKYLVFMFYPVGYSIQHYTDLVTSIASIWFIGPMLLLAGLAGAMVASRSRMLWFSAVWFLVLLAPALAGMSRFGREFLVQERYLYLPSMGACLAVALAIGHLATMRVRSWSGRGVAAALAASLVVVLAWQSVEFNRVWYSNISIGENAVARSGGRPEARLFLVGAYYSAGLYKEADAQAHKVLELEPEAASPYAILSQMANIEGKLDKAIEYLETGIARVKPQGTPATNALGSLYLNLGLMYSRRGEFDRAEQALLKSVEIYPRPTGYYYVGQFYFDRRRFDDARQYFEKVRDSAPRSFFPIQLKLGMAYERLGLKEQARAAYEQYLRLAPDEVGERVEAARGLSRL